MLAGDPGANLDTVKRKHFAVVILHHPREGGALRDDGRGPVKEIVRDLGQAPGFSARAATYHHPVGAGVRQRLPCRPRIDDVAIGNYRDPDRVAHGPDGRPIG